MEFILRIARDEDTRFADKISSMYAESAKERGTGIAVRKPEYIMTKIRNGNAIIALQDEEIAGFCYVEVFSSNTYVSNSGLIVSKLFRGQGLSRRIKESAFALARMKFPEAQVFGITTSPIVMNINSDLGYRPVSFAQLTQDEEFWKGCSSCPNYDILLRNSHRLCLCTGMLAPSNIEIKYDISHLIIEEVHEK